ncbi:hypothetical protein JTE90_008535 [Oedothorax gibbosus]|uniref:PNT domain-containing protein n=1 Tax=Oedothorax gibbosus TaxID=931172 RepID=A0AAV6VIX5_9ARAC|nr:hypothetical protein JTE90_008535 [Oedothorax gibbosus]
MLCSQAADPLPPMAWPDRGISSLTGRMWDSASLRRIIEDFSSSRHLPVPSTRNAEPTLPSDPTQWSRDDVRQWVSWISSTQSLPPVHLDRFSMNGKALCLMSIDMFVARVPLGGKLLYKDFQLRLSRALYS